ncbi:MAG: sodium:proton antiporter [Clostridia bacterium]|nr:sodium:proton antiporter [Clostridia bacterium]
MALWQNLPFLLILLPLAASSGMLLLKKDAARRAALTIMGLEAAVSAAFLVCMAGFEGSYTYSMGHFPAPWGNEIRAGKLEAALAFCFAAVMFCSVLGGIRAIERDILPDRRNLYFIMCSLTLSALMAQVFTNDIFTGYVFLEIMTIAACALIAARNTGRALTAATRYMIMNLIGSGLFLLALSLLYGLTGHLLMSPARERIAALAAGGQYRQPLTVVVALTTIALGIKSALFPFHTWVPDAYSFSTPSSSAILSSLVSKGYIVLLLKLYYRVFSPEVLLATGAADVLFAFGAVGAVVGSLLAIRQVEIGRMIAYSSVAQIGYIYMAMGLGTGEGMLAAVFQLMAHTVVKALLFLAAGGLCDASGGHHAFRDLRGSYYRHPAAASAFILGAFSLIGIPFTAGFIVKLTYAQAAAAVGGGRMLILFFVLVAGTLMNAVYFGRTVITLFRARGDEIPGEPRWHGGAGFLVSCAFLAGATGLMGVTSDPVLQLLRRGLETFG